MSNHDPRVWLRGVSEKARCKIRQTDDTLPLPPGLHWARGAPWIATEIALVWFDRRLRAIEERLGLDAGEP